MAAALGIRADRSPDFFDALVAMGFLNRDGDGPTSSYTNAPETDLFLDKNKPSYTGGMPEMLNARLFGFWNGLTDALRSGAAQNESKHGGQSVFGALYADEGRLEQFLSAMASLQVGNFATLANRFDFSKHRTVLDVGGANALLSRTLVAHHAHLSCLSFDLPAVAPIARREIARAGLEPGGRVQSQQCRPRRVVDARRHATARAAHGRAHADAARSLQGAAFRHQGRVGRRVRSGAHHLASHVFLLGQLDLLRHGTEGR